MRRHPLSQKCIPRDSSTRIAITGGIAEGKTTVLGWIAEHGFSVSSSDEIARHLFADAGVRARVASIAGLEEPFEPADLRSRLLGSATLRRSINRLLHPLIRDEGVRRAATFSEVPLLIETCQWSDYDQVWMVTCGAEEQFRRLCARCGEHELAQRLLSIQLPTAAKLPFGDVIIRTNQEPERVRSELASLLFAMKV